MTQSAEAKPFFEPHERKAVQTELSRKALAALCGISRMAVSDLEHGGVLQATAEGKFSIERAVPAIVTHLRSRKSPEKIADETTLRRLKLEAAELKLLREKDELIPRKMAQDLLLAVGGDMILHVRSLPSHLSRDPKARRAFAEIIERRVIEPIAEKLKAGGYPLKPPLEDQ